MMKRNRSRHTVTRHQRASKGVLLVMGLAFAGILFASFFFDEMGVPKYLEMRRHAQQLEQEIGEIERSNAELRRDIARLQHDPVRIEELARERLGFVRKGETVYQVVEEADNPGPAGKAK
jgi:cell division protein FtsB